MRAWLALREARVDFEEEIVDIRRPQRFPNLAKIGNISPPAMVPVLLVGEATIFDSLAIMEYANDLCRKRLLPQVIGDRARARSILAWQHSGLSNICSRISFESAFYPFKRQLLPHEQEECARLFAFLDQTLELSGGPYLFGDMSLADLALVPTIVRLCRHKPPMSDWGRVHVWTEELLNRASVREWMSEADALPHVWLDEYCDAEGELTLVNITPAAPMHPGEVLSAYPRGASSFA